MAARKDNKAVFFASESWMLAIASSRHGVEIQDIIPIVEDMHYTFGFDKHNLIEKPKVKHMPCTYEPTVYNHQNNWNNKSPNFHVVNGSQQNTAAVVKAIPEKKTIPAGSLAYYIGKKDLQVEIVGKCVDTNGSKYIKLMDPDNIAAPLRMYPHKKDPRNYTIGRELLVEISGFVNKPDEGDFFKASPHNITMLAEKPVAQFLYDDGKGHKLTKKEWEDKYPHCDWCFDPLFAEDHGNRFNGAGGCFCGKCSENKEVRADFKLTPVITH